MEIEVTYSHTIDLAIWTCPKCGHTNEIQCDSGFDDGVCEECEFEIPEYHSRMYECDGETETYYIEEDEEEDCEDI